MTTDADSVGDAKAWLRTKLDDGADCPCCGQLVKMYKRKINRGMAQSLIKMYNTAGKSWIHVSDIGAASREEGKLAYWGLVEEMSTPSTGVKRSGYWKVTDKGEKFIKLELKVPKYAKVYNQKVYGFTGEDVDIVDALSTYFVYSDIMMGI